MTISERIAAARRERRVLARVCRAAWQLNQAGRERTWALASARVEGISIRTLAAAIGLSPSRVHQLVAEADPDALDAALGELRAAGWPPAMDPDRGGHRYGLARVSDEVSWLRQCAGRSAARRGRLPADGQPDDRHRRRPTWTNSPAPGGPGDLDTAAVLPDPRAERRRWLAEPDLEFRSFCARTGLPASSTLQLGRAWDAWQAERYRRGETGQRPGYTGNPFRPR